MNVENYLRVIQNRSLRVQLTKLILSNYELNIKTRGHRRLQRCHGYCLFCKSKGVIEDERHVLFACHKYDELKEPFYRKLNCINELDKLQDRLKLLETFDKKSLVKLVCCKFH